MPSKVQQKKLNILLIEDNPGDERLVREMLRSIKDIEMHLDHADSMASGKEVLASSQPDIVLLDLSLPDSQGLATFQNLRDCVPNIPVIVLTGREDATFGLAAVQDGAQDYLTKSEINDRLLLHAVLYAVERKKAAEALRSSEANLRTIITSNADGIIVMDHAGSVLFVNPAAEVLLNRTADELVGQPFGFPAVDSGAVEIELVRRDGTTPVVEMRTVRMEWQGKKVLLASLRDITERKKMEDALGKANSKLKKTVAELEKANKTILQQQKSVIEEERLKLLLQMAGATAHELSQPLSVLLQSVDLMQDDVEDPERLERHINLVKESGGQIKDIVRKMQKVPRYEVKSYDADTFIINFDPEIAVLSVEDLVEDFEKIKKLLKDNPRINILHAKSIEEAFQSLKSSQVDFVLLDHILPDGNSLEFFKLLDNNEVEIPVVVITGQGDEMIASQIIQAGAYDYLPKERLGKKSLSRCIMNALEKHRLKQEIKHAMDRMARMAVRDELTGLYNRRFFTEALEREVARAKRYNSGLVLCIMDLDDFKQINDTYGHPAGDMLLSQFGRMLNDCFRQSDLVCRYGGEEFAVILPSTSSKNALKVCERFRKTIAEHVFTYEAESFNTTVSTGIAALSNNYLKNPDELVSVCDRSLYRAKQSGKNQIVVFTEVTPP